MPRPGPIPDAHYRELRQRFSAADENYNFLNASHAVFGRRGVWDGDFARQQYLRSADHLIGVLDGTITEREVGVGPQNSWSAPDVVVWLDKSARPASWFVDAFWDQFAAPGADKPRYEFLRIDRRDWLVHMGYSDMQARNATPKTVQVDAVPEELILRMRALFCAGPIDPDGWRHQVATAPTTLDGRNVVVIDETMVSGATLRVATGLLARIAPSATVSGTYFWRDSTSKAIGGVVQHATVPVWYPGENNDGSEVTVFGRGVGNSSAAYWDQRPDSDAVFRNRIAATMVSAPHHDPDTFEPLPDPLADMLAQDIAYLTYDYAAGRVLRRPSPLREDDDFDRIIEEQGIAFADFVGLNDRHAREVRNGIGL